MFEKGNKIGNRFTSENQPKSSGRKPSLYRRIKELTGKKVGFELEYGDFCNIIRWVLEQSPKDIERLLVTKDGKPNKSTPLWLTSIISAINKDIKAGQISTLDSLFDRLFGKAVSKIEGNVVMDVNADLKDMSEDELKAEVERLSEALK